MIDKTRSSRRFILEQQHLGSVPQNGQTDSPTTPSLSCEAISASVMMRILSSLRMARQAVLNAYDLVDSELTLVRDRISRAETSPDVAALVASTVSSVWTETAAAVQSSLEALNEATWALTSQTDSMEATSPTDEATSDRNFNCRIAQTDEETAPDDSAIDIKCRSIVGPFLQMAWPAYWSRKLAGGNPEESFEEAVRLNNARRAAFGRKIDPRIRRLEAMVSAIAPVDSQENPSAA
jgi:hypothetical protein